MDRLPGARRWLVPLLALLVVVEALVGVGLITAELASRGPAQAAPPGAAAEPGQGRVGPDAEELRARREAEREQAVRALLDARAAAVLAKDQAAFLATVDPADPALQQQQATWFANLSAVPFASFDYALDARGSRGIPPLQEGEEEQGWVPPVRLSYAVAGVDDGSPVVQDTVLVFVQRDGRWVVSGTEAPGAPDPRSNLWDHGPVVVERTADVVALGHPGDEPELRRLAGVVQTAIPAVTDVWGPDWAQKVLLVLPQERAEVEALAGSQLDLDQIAAVATAVLRPGRGDAVGERIVVNPVPFAALSRLGQQVVLTHETVHVAARDATGENVPVWLAEGLADLVAYRSTGLSVRQAAAELGEEVRRGEVPAALPTAEDFAGAGDRLPAVYESAWLAVKLIADTTDDETLLRFYRQVGAERGGTAVHEAMLEVLGTDLETFTAAWQADLRAELG